LGCARAARAKRQANINIVLKRAACSREGAMIQNWEGKRREGTRSTRILGWNKRPPSPSALSVTLFPPSIQRREPRGCATGALSLQPRVPSLPKQKPRAAARHAHSSSSSSSWSGRGWFTACCSSASTLAWASMSMTTSGGARAGAFTRVKELSPTSFLAR